MYKKRSRRKQRIVNKINIYINLILIIIIITIIILLGIFSCPCVLSAACGRCRTACPSVSGWCVYGGEQELVKIFTDRQMMASWQVLEAVSEEERYWGMFSAENNGRTAMATFDNLYRKCYNKCNDNNKNVICHQSPKFTL